MPLKRAVQSRLARVTHVSFFPRYTDTGTTGRADDNVPEEANDVAPTVDEPRTPVTPVIVDLTDEDTHPVATDTEPETQSLPAFDDLISGDAPEPEGIVERPSFFPTLAKEAAEHAKWQAQQRTPEAQQDGDDTPKEQALALDHTDKQIPVEQPAIVKPPAPQTPPPPPGLKRPAASRFRIPRDLPTGKTPGQKPAATGAATAPSKPVAANGKRVLDLGENSKSQHTPSAIKRISEKLDAVKTKSVKSLPSGLQESVQTVTQKSQRSLVKAVQTVRNPDDKVLINPERPVLITGLVVLGIGVIIGFITLISTLSGVSGIYEESAAPITQPIAEFPEIAAVAPIDTTGKNPNVMQNSNFLVDGDDASAWQSVIYPEANYGGNGGNGLEITLKAPAKVNEITITSPDKGGKMEVRATTIHAPTQGDVLATATFDSGQLKFAKPVTTDTFVVWFSQLPENADGKYQADISEVSVK